MIMGTSIIGFLTLIGVFAYCLVDRTTATAVGFFDMHAAVIVFGGVLGALLIALDQNSLHLMLKSLIHLAFGRRSFEKEISGLRNELSDLRNACREGKRAVLLNYIEKSTYAEVRCSSEILLGQLQGNSAAEKYAEIRNTYLSRYEPVIEGWDLISRLAPSFGMVGTVTGMVQLFRNMSESTGNLGGAMGMALLATLYGIAFGAAVGGPMSTRISNELNEKLNLVDLFETTIGALVQEFRQGQGDKK
jgi:chemotaxis protein MotA